jgi:aryl-alcohol dehydrogenase-like predicted oxidoreductase
MEYRRLGNSGLKVSGIGLGANEFGRRADESTSIAVVSRALDLGVNFIDTADLYSSGRSEEFVGKAIKGKRTQVVVATKFGNPTGEGPNDKGASRNHIMVAVEASLRRLQTDYIDLYQVHKPDPTTPIEETLRALDDLLRAGKVRYIGCSNFAAWQVCEALWTSRVHRLSSFVTVQARYNILERQVESEIVPCCQAYGIGVIPWGPLMGGFLTGKYHRGEKGPPDARLSVPNRTRSYRTDRIFTETHWDALARLEAFATERGHTVAELALAWLLSRPWVSSVIAGARVADQVSANVTSAGWKLTADELAGVEAIITLL